MLLPTLALPPIHAKCMEIEGKWKIFDKIRKKYIVLTPEEWVRQHLLCYLTDHLHYPPGLIRVEMPLKTLTRQRRSDLVIYDATGSVHMIAECKKPSVKLNIRVLQQAMHYYQALKAPYVAITNGMNILCIDMRDKSHISDSVPPYVGAL
ncbi:MAG: type I restriction enzyme HsdR N-terminal domain-containing protein [Cytophagales bacterium]|nr:type I restriction enzyme HsdR N-terminal domain-containing protein [Cytophagales bacterium]